MSVTLSQAKQMIIEEISSSRSPASSAVQNVHHAIAVLQSMEVEDDRNIEWKTGLLNEMIDSAIEKLENLKQ